MTIPKLMWPNATGDAVPVWRLCDFSGLTKSHRESEDALRNQQIFLNGALVQGKRDTVFPWTRCHLALRQDGVEVKHITFDLRYHTHLRHKTRVSL